MSLIAGFAGGSAALRSAHAAPPAFVPAEPRLVPRDLPRCRAAGDRARRPRPRGLVQAPRRGAETLRVEEPRLGPARQPSPSPDRDVASATSARDAAPERAGRDALQPALRPQGPPLPGALPEPGDRGRAPPRERDLLHLRERDAGRSPRVAVALPRAESGGLCCPRRDE